ncbi:kinase [Clostridium sp. DJ247]|uniref:GHMP family kinase ATP-binding protein n=1 Tax=Clostridium sp. DJ247 TaxID=2726188 RepID=UPI001624A16B|nr:kinase [Clostridium sp. DJ247]MBC2582195.1 kinase [Clostridium sp. DJ247]
METVTFYPGSFGEILQGKIQNKDMLISSPVNIYTRIRLFECCNSNKKLRFKKSSDFLYNILKLWGLEEYEKNIDIEIKSQIPYGKGMASSTADLCGLYHCLIKMFKRQFNEDELIEQCINIEPTDSIIFDKMTLFNYKDGLYKETLGDYFNYNILAFEGNKVIDTVKFNQMKLPGLSQVDDLVPILKEAVKEKSIEKLAYVSTESIVRNQKRLNYNFLHHVLDIKYETGGLGIIGAHSGNVLGIVYSDIEKLNYGITISNKVSSCKIYSVEALDSYNRLKERKGT